MSNTDKLLRLDRYAGMACDWMRERPCTMCFLFSLFAIGFIGGVVVRGWFA